MLKIPKTQTPPTLKFRSLNIADTRKFRNIDSKHENENPQNA